MKATFFTKKEFSSIVLVEEGSASAKKFQGIMAQDSQSINGTSFTGVLRNPT
ncbi:hypothetical protein J21TS3_48370 [Paenibacillus cookii]|uniref:Uncharacterized protein n=1 Tax=Paenibacillus cookii TaxID=157839 RepID=A0ABQ4M3D9_9BACL|nr:hypothetical protein J21TS3_48370 [Paenibacillus cookii]